MAKSSKPRKKNSSSISSRELRSIENIKSLLKNTIIGSVQIHENAQITIRNGKLLEVPTKAMADAFIHVKFKYVFLLGIVHRQTNGVPMIEYQICNLSHHSKLYSKELDPLIFGTLKEMWNNANPNTKLTSLWIASPNPEMEDNDLASAVLLLLDKYKVYDNMITNYDTTNNIERGRSLHNTDYWYSLVEFKDYVHAM